MTDRRQFSKAIPAGLLAVCAAAVCLGGGCHQHPPVDFWCPRDCRHYEQMAAEVAAAEAPCERGFLAGSGPPATLRNIDEQQLWDLPLQEAVHIALGNSPIIRQLPPLIAPVQGGAAVPLATDATLRVPDASASIYDPAIQASNVGRVVGVDAALSAFDTSFAMSMFWEKNERPINVSTPAEVIFARDFMQDLATFRGEFTKTAVTGARLFARQNVIYDLNNNPTRAVPSDYNLNYELGVTQPLWQGAGRLFNEVAGPGGQPGIYNGVLIARINSDISLMDFEIAVRDQVGQVETAYWELFLAWRAFHSARTGRDAALTNWRNAEAELRVGRIDAVREAQARSEYFRFTDRMQATLCELFAAENRLRYLLGLPAGDGRVIRPCDEPTMANIAFDWEQIHWEALARSPELRRQRWRIKQRELELTAAEHFLKPRVDGLAQYRWVGAGDDLMGSRGVPPFAGSDAYSTLASGKYQEWQLGIQMSVPLGFRQGWAAVRNAELHVARERARLDVQEQELMHLLAEAVRNADCSHTLAMTRFNRLQAASQEVESALAALPRGRIPYSDVLSAFARRAEAETDYFRALVNYQRAIVQVHLRKGSLLEHNEVYLAEAPYLPSAVSPHHGRRLFGRLQGRFNYSLAHAHVMQQKGQSTSEDHTSVAAVTVPSQPSNVAPQSPAAARFTAPAQRAPDALESTEPESVELELPPPPLQHPSRARWR
jgi:outer membrane protein TolC